MKNVGILKYSLMVKNFRNINEKNITDVLQAYRCPLCDNVVGDSIS